MIKDGCPLPFNAQNESTLDKNILAGLWANDNLLCLIFVNQQEHWVLIGFTVVVTPNYFQRVSILSGFLLEYRSLCVLDKRFIQEDKGQKLVGILTLNLCQCLLIKKLCYVSFFASRWYVPIKTHYYEIGPESKPAKETLSGHSLIFHHAAHKENFLHGAPRSNNSLLHFSALYLFCVLNVAHSYRSI